MKIHEYQAKQILARHGVPIPRGQVAHTVEEAVAVAKGFGDGPYVVKAQIHAGGRGKGGGVKVTKTLEEAEAAANSILGMQLVTHQTGPEGQEVQKLLVEEGVGIEREIYLGLVIDRHRECPVMMASAQGGMDIEEVAASNPEAIFFENIDPDTGLAPYQGRLLAARLGVPAKCIGQFAKVAVALSKVMVEEDCALAEINPLIITTDEKVMALDAKITFDDNALYRHPEFMELRDLAEEDALEVRASEHNLSYINMDGNIGCMVNGAGLAMATMDIIKIHGGEPANFLDVGGGATKERVSEAFRIILQDENVKAILINIFGGIVRCDLIANGVVDAAKGIGIKIPVVVRLAGNKVEEGKKILAESGLELISADDLEDAAQKAVAAGGVA